jgi:hypothetical protein
MHNSMRWPLSALMIAIAIAASACGVFTAFWDASHPNHVLLLGTFILLVCVSTVAALFGKASLRCPFIGASLFGTAYLVFVLHCGFGLETIHDSEWLARNTKLGFALFGISFLASQLSQMVAWPNSQSQSARIVDEQSHALEPAAGSDSSGKSSPPAQ